MGLLRHSSAAAAAHRTFHSAASQAPSPQLTAPASAASFAVFPWPFSPASLCPVLPVACHCRSSVVIECDAAQIAHGEVILCGLRAPASALSFAVLTWPFSPTSLRSVLPVACHSQGNISSNYEGTKMAHGRALICGSRTPSSPACFAGRYGLFFPLPFVLCCRGKFFS